MGMAFTIAIGQVARMLGVDAAGETCLQKTVNIFRLAGDWHWLPLVVGAGCLAVLLLMGRLAPRLPGAIFVVIAATLLAWLLDLGNHGLSFVGSSPGGLPAWMLRGVSLEDVYHLLPGALAVALALAATSMEKGHIAVDLLVNRLPQRGQIFLDAISSLFGLALFAALTWQSALYALDLRQSGEVSATLGMPVYPFAAGIAAGCALLCLVLGTEFGRCLRRIGS